jgi:hypothetical protein
MDNDSALAAEAMAWQLSDEGGKYRDHLQPFRDLLAAQRDALAGHDDDTYCTEYGPF